MSAAPTDDARIAAHVSEITAAVDAQPLLRLEHAAIHVGDVAHGSDWYRRVLGLDEIAREDGIAYLTCGAEPGFDLALVPGEHGLDHYAYSVDGEQTLDDLAAMLGTKGIAAQRATDPQPGVAASLRFRQDTADTDLELIVRAERPSYPGAHSWTAHGATGPLRINHVTFAGGDPARFCDFMVEVLRFRVSDVWIPAGSGAMRMAFLRVGENHHDTAMLEGETLGLHHTAFLVRDIGGLASLSDRVIRAGEMGETGIVRHGPGNNVAFYVRDPWGNRNELTTDIAIVNDPKAGVKVWDEQVPIQLYNTWAPVDPPASWIHEVS